MKKKPKHKTTASQLPRDTAQQQDLQDEKRNVFFKVNLKDSHQGQALAPENTTPQLLAGAEYLLKLLKLTRSRPQVQQGRV